MCVSNSLQLLSEKFLVPRRKRFYHKSTLVFMLSTRYSCQILMKFEFSRQIFEKYSNTKLHENPSGWGRVVLCGRTDGQAGRLTDKETDRQTNMSKLRIAFQNLWTCIKFHLILSSLLRVCCPSGLFPSGFPTKTLYRFLTSPTHNTSPVLLILLDFITPGKTDYEPPLYVLSPASY
jgi:hypothetical protein